MIRFFLRRYFKLTALLVLLALCWPGASVLYAQQRPTTNTGILLQTHKGPVHITATQFIYDDKHDTFTAKGNAVLTQAHTVLKADSIEVIRRDRQALAVGHVHLIDPQGEIYASRAKIDLDQETARLTDAKVLASDNTYHLEGKEIIKHLGQSYSVKDGYFTTCGCSKTPAWSIKADEMDVHLGSIGTARDASFNVMGYPVLKLPYAIFPTATRRQSGLLSPRMAESGLRGFQFFQPYYLDINKSSDATFALDVETAQRIGLLSEYRLVNGKDDYLKINFGFYNESIRSNINRESDIIDNQIADPHIPVDRYGIIGNTRQHLTPNLVAYGDAISVSDSLYLREMNVWTLSRGYGTSFASMRNAVSHFGLLDSFNDGFVRLQGTWNQDLIQEQRFALQTLPQLLLSGRRELPGGFAYTDYDASITNFWRSRGVGGWRFDLNPRVVVPWRLGDYAYGSIAAGLDETVYDTSGHALNVIPVGTNGLVNNNGLTLGPLTRGGLQNRLVPTFEARFGTELERVYDLNWSKIEKIKHTIDPFVEYTYIPPVDQGSLPLFDALDDINPRSLIIYGFTSRIYAKMAPRPASASVSAPSAAQQDQGDESVPEGAALFGGPAVGPPLRSGRVEEVLRLTLENAYDTTQAVAPDGSGISDIMAKLVVFPNRLIYLGSSVGYDPRQRQQIDYANVYLNFQPWWTNNTPPLYMGRAVTGSFLRLGYTFIGPNASALRANEGNTSEYLTLRAYYDLFDRMGVFFSPSYDLATGKMLSAEYGVRFKSPCDCWAFDFGIVDNTNPSELQFLFQLTLGGIGSIGRSPFGRNPFQTTSGILPR